jgi:hypothetical protein
MEQTTKTKSITLRPNWVGTAQMLIAILEGSATISGKKWAREEILRMGRIIDEYQLSGLEQPATCWHCNAQTK